MHEKRQSEKKRAAKKALRFVKEGMIVGLGSGSTMAYFVKCLGELCRTGLNIKCVATSKQIEKEAKKAKLRLIRIQRTQKIDLAIDGADQVDKNKNLLKGSGAYAFVKEKEIDYKAKKCIIIVDKSKLSKKLNKKVWVQIKNENKKAEQELKHFSKKMGYKIKKKKRNIFMLKFKQINNPQKLEKVINNMGGVVDNGIFANFKKPIKIVIGYRKGAKII